MLNLLTGALQPTDGMVRRHHHLKISKYAQHFLEELPLDMSPLQYMLKEFPKDFDGNVFTPEKMRSVIGRFGITGPVQTMKIQQLSDGQVSRLAFARIYMQRPHLLLLDEPTNHLDIESIDSLAEAINNFDGGMCLVSHDMRLISQVANEIWICDKGTLTRYEGSIMDFKLDLQKELVAKEQVENPTKSESKTSQAKVSKSVPSKQLSELTVGGKTFSAVPQKKGDDELSFGGKMFTMSARKKDDDVSFFGGKGTSKTKTETKETDKAAAETPKQSRYIPPHLR